MAAMHITPEQRARYFPPRAGWIRLLDEQDWQGHGAQREWTRGPTLYLMQEVEAGGFLKVGIAAHPLRRLESIQCGNPRPIALRAVFVGERRHCLAAERTVLSFFGSVRAKGEWLAAPLDDVLRYIEECQFTSRGHEP